MRESTASHEYQACKSDGITPPPLGEGGDTSTGREKQPWNDTGGSSYGGGDADGGHNDTRQAPCQPSAYRAATPMLSKIMAEP